MRPFGSARRQGRVLLVAATLSALVAAASPATATTTVAGPAAHVDVPARAPETDVGRSSIDWESCGEELVGYDCATVTVPLDHDRRHRGTTELALTRYRATDTAQRIGSVFVNFGGPGVPGAAIVLSGFGQLLGDQLAGRFDVIGFDPRGVGASDPLHCFDSEEELNAALTGQPIFPYRKDQYRPFFDAYATLGRDCADQRIARHMSTANVARDMDLLRRAVGDRKLTYLGFSYGSYVGNTYANLFPDKVRAVAVDGVLDPRLWSGGRQIESDRVNTQVVFEEFLRLCDEARTDCPFWTPEGSAERWERLLAAVHRDPVELPGDVVYTYDFLISDAVAVTNAPEIWAGEQGVAAFFDLLADAALGDDVAAAADAARLRAGLVEGLTAGIQGLDHPDDSEGPDYPNAVDAFYGNHCADAQYPHRFSRWVEVGRYAERGSPFGPFWWWANVPCAQWPVDEDRYTGPWTARTSAPVLVVGSYYDGVTGYAGAVATDRLLRNSRLLSYAGWGHTAYGRSECATEHVNDYLLTGALPPEGEVCPANPNPFLAAATARLGTTPLAVPPPSWLPRPELPSARAGTS